MAIGRRLLPLLREQPLAADAIKASEFKMAGDAMKMRVVLQFDREPDPKWFLLRGPHRLVIDLPETTFVVEPKSLKARGLVTQRPLRRAE